MSRITILLKDGNKYVSVKANKFYEYENKYKIFFGDNLIAVFDVEMVQAIYMTEERIDKK